MAAECLTTITEQWIRDRLQLKHPSLADVRSLSLPGTYEEKIRHLGNALTNFVRLKSLDLSCNALVSVEGVQHLKMLERLILYYNSIPSLEEVKVLYELLALRELDLRLNPLTKNDPNYRPYLVHAMPNLRKLDSCPVRDTERKAAIMQFSSDLLPQQKSSCLNQVEHQRYADYQMLHVNEFQLKLYLTQVVSLLISTSSFSEFAPQGSYRKPLEMLLNLVDKHWTGEKSLHHNNNFLSQAVQILSMMENDISSREAEVRNLRREADALSFQAAAREEEHKTEVRNLSAQLEETRSGKLNEQLRIVLEENVALQKQLIKLERQYLKSMMKSSPITQIKGGCKCQSLVATNECLLAELKGSGEH
uniref:Centrosomal protein of 72 kDa n=1 Tax=Seriola lalandi dorsalis TaxID=1841481 RepID=A0A3B4YAZ0_SERLL